MTKCPVCVCTYVRATVNMSLNFTLWNKNPIYSNNVSVKVPRIESTLYSIARKKTGLRTLNRSYVQCLAHASFSLTLSICMCGFFSTLSEINSIYRTDFSDNVANAQKCGSQTSDSLYGSIMVLLVFRFFFSIDKNHFTLNFTWNSWKSSNYILQWLLTEWNIVLLLFSTMTQQTFSQLFD